jgi:uncharacterized glyoxalase superfamily protein PhnB
MNSGTPPSAALWPANSGEIGARGVTFNEPEIQEAPWGRWKTCDDPDGNSWVVQQNNPDFG